jgi:hypothetical protein
VLKRIAFRCIHMHMKLILLKRNFWRAVRTNGVCMWNTRILKRWYDRQRRMMDWLPKGSYTMGIHGTYCILASRSLPYVQHNHILLQRQEVSCYRAAAPTALCPPLSVPALPRPWLLPRPRPLPRPLPPCRLPHASTVSPPVQMRAYPCIHPVCSSALCSLSLGASGQQHLPMSQLTKQNALRTNPARKAWKNAWRGNIADAPVTCACLKSSTARHRHVTQRAPQPAYADCSCFAAASNYHVHRCLWSGLSIVSGSQRGKRICYKADVIFSV